MSEIFQPFYLATFSFLFFGDFKLVPTAKLAEVIVPNFTFIASANAIQMCGAIPKFCDITDDLQININDCERLITEKTKAIAVVHYAGVSCDMHSIMKIANEHNLIVIEDAAQGIMSSFDGKPLGSIAHIGCVSFHETKNIQCGEGGLLSINNSQFKERAEIISKNLTFSKPLIFFIAEY